MRGKPNEPGADSLGKKLEAVIANLPPDGVTLAEIRDLIGPDGLLLLIVFLSIVFMVPVSIPGVSVIFGGAILLIGVSRLRSHTLWLPKRLAQRVLSTDKVRTGLTKGSFWLHRLERVCRPRRLKGLASPGLPEKLNDCTLILGALLLMAPIILVPFSNTLPALALLFLSIGMLQRDGLCVLFGHLSNLITIAYFIALGAGGSAALREAFQHVAGKAL